MVIGDNVRFKDGRTDKTFLVSGINDKKWQDKKMIEAASIQIEAFGCIFTACERKDLFEVVKDE